MCEEWLHKNCVPTDATLTISKSFSSLLKNQHIGTYFMGLQCNSFVSKGDFKCQKYD